MQIADEWWSVAAVAREDLIFFFFFPYDREYFIGGDAPATPLRLQTELMLSTTPVPLPPPPPPHLPPPLSPPPPPPHPPPPQHRLTTVSHCTRIKWTWSRDANTESVQIQLANPAPPKKKSLNQSNSKGVSKRSGQSRETQLMPPEQGYYIMNYYCIVTVNINKWK